MIVQPTGPALDAARADLAFLRALAERPSEPGAAAGRFSLMTGLIWAFDALVLWTHHAGLVTLSAAQQQIFVAMVTLIWLALSFWMRWGAPAAGAPHPGAAARAYRAAVAGIGMAQLATLAVFFVAAFRFDLGEVFIIYPSMMFLFFGASWLAAFMLWRNAWRLAVALGWFAAAVGLAAGPGDASFIAIAGLAMLLLMALPGWVMMRTAKGD